MTRTRGIASDGGSRHGRRTTRILLTMLTVVGLFGAATGIARAGTANGLVWAVGPYNPALLVGLVGLFAAMSLLVAVMYRRLLREQARFVRRTD